MKLCNNCSNKSKGILCLFKKVHITLLLDSLHWLLVCFKNVTACLLSFKKSDVIMLMWSTYTPGRPCRSTNQFLRWSIIYRGEWACYSQFSHFSGKSTLRTWSPAPLWPRFHLPPSLSQTCTMSYHGCLSFSPQITSSLKHHSVVHGQWPAQLTKKLASQTHTPQTKKITLPKLNR